MYSGSSTRASLIHPRVRVSYVSQDEGSLGDQQWSSSAGHVQGVGSGRDRSCPDFHLYQLEASYIVSTIEKSLSFILLNVLKTKVAFLWRVVYILLYRVFFGLKVCI
ncbi:hypothetical protein MTR67_021413 [Solanum verrucosum]|uniref:Uncharacterized protein n=1 Tax=Solanum verrucosum TaxID=315347 RepID=A0AAF0TWT6_SOLVR|nr:hypothetical protein MTR67_021413 [Solanum verrucosum]